MERDFRIAAGILLSLLTCVRGYYQIQSRRISGPQKEFESKTNVALRMLLALAMFGVLVSWLAGAGWLEFASVRLPLWLRSTGAAIGVLGLGGLVEVHRALGRNFSGTLHLRGDQELVMSGPYRYVRHPMYTAFYLILIGFALLSANWLIGGGMLVGLTTVMLSRVKREEQVMTERFGQQYIAYISRTGRFFPRL